MSRYDWARNHVMRTLRSRALDCPQRYVQMLSETPHDMPIRGLAPWIFLPDPARSSLYCTEAFGAPLLAFAQAVGEDLVASFLPDAATPAIIVLNPWATTKRLMRRAELPSFDTWVSYAYHVACSVRARHLLAAPA